MRFRIYYEDTDSGGIVYHSNYLKFCERARSALFFEKNLLPQNQEGSFVIHSLQARYLDALKLGDEIEVILKILEKKYSSIIVAHKINKISEIHQRDPMQKEVFYMEAKIVFTKNGRIKKIPQNFIEVFDAK